MSAISVTAPSTRRTIPISDRTTAGETPSERLGTDRPLLRFRREACEERRVVERDVDVRRRVAIG